MATWKEKFNEKYKFEKDTPHSLPEIAKLTGYRLSGLRTIFNKGYMAYFTNPESVRPNVTSPEQWGMGRIYSAVMGGASARVDKKHLQKI